MNETADIITNSANPDDNRLWFALRVTYNRELRVRDELDALGFTTFVPMQYKKVVRGGRMVKRLVASVHNLVFVLTQPERLTEYMRQTQLPVRYIYNRTTRRPVVVPRYQMDNFIAVAGTYHEQLIYLNPDPNDFTSGDRVRILGGPFEGAEGVFVRVKGDRRVVVSIEGVVAVATTYIHPSLLQKID